MLRNKILAKLISLTSFTHYKCWGRYKANQEDKIQ